MKKLLPMLIALLVFMGACAFALNGANYPAWDGSSPPKNSLCGQVDGQVTALEFDPAGEYSNIADGLIQACFFAFDESQTNYLELYLKIPENAAAGDVFSHADMANAASITLYEVLLSQEDFYFASQALGIPYPAGSSYELCIEKAERSAESISISGSLNATLVLMDGSAPTDKILKISDARFDFALPLNASSAKPAPTVGPVPEATAGPAPTEGPQQPQASMPPILPFILQTPRPTMDPHPAFTLPPDYRVI